MRSRIDFKFSNFIGMFFSEKIKSGFFCMKKHIPLLICLFLPIVTFSAKKDRNQEDVAFNQVEVEDIVEEINDKLVRNSVKVYLSGEAIPSHEIERLFKKVLGLRSQHRVLLLEFFLEACGEQFTTKIKHQIFSYFLSKKAPKHLFEEEVVLLQLFIDHEFYDQKVFFEKKKKPRYLYEYALPRVLYLFWDAYNKQPVPFQLY